MSSSTQDIGGYTYDFRRALAELPSALASQERHLAAMGEQILVANQLGDFDAVHALAAILKTESEGAYQDDYPHFWNLLQADDEERS